MDYISFCKNYFAVTRIPVSFLDGITPLYSSLGELLNLEYMGGDERFWDSGQFQGNPAFCRYSPDIEYGCVHIEGTDYRMILGPSFSIPVTNQITRAYMHENAIPLEYREAVTELLSSIPTISHAQFAKHLALLHQVLNQKEMQLEDYFPREEGTEQRRTEEQLLQRMNNLENSSYHNSWRYEQNLFACIKNGDVRQLEEALSAPTELLGEGKLANTPLRHAKNLFILTVAKVAVLSAIPAGVDTEKTYQLVDLYIQECEQQLTIDAVRTLQYSMLRDFCTLAGENHIPEGISAEVYQCINYVRSHTNAPISVNSVADHIHRSPSYTMKLFKEELGINLGAFITRCKLEEAKSLLAYSEKSLAEISSYLCFSSQSYFQNVFKKKYGTTPLQYRKEKGKI
ncbi:MAG: AraC family transcriptional regulator [Roseburia sp.]|nr:AraC family transcriptional regulator [Roseburia sp.]MCM1098977.1 AraC family transcriptional regulator [Ruminococcus flavefaciens]